METRSHLAITVAAVIHKILKNFLLSCATRKDYVYEVSPSLWGVTLRPLDSRIFFSYRVVGTRLIIKTRLATTAGMCFNKSVYGVLPLSGRRKQDLLPRSARRDCTLCVYARATCNYVYCGSIPPVCFLLHPVSLLRNT